MSDGTESPTRATPDGDGPGVLANLPRTRPQRPSARRADARRAAARKADATSAPASADDRQATRGSQPPAGEGAAPQAAEPTTSKRTAGRNGRKAASRSKPGGRTAKATRRPRRPTSKLDDVPRQGYESEEGAATGAVQPPGGAELVVSAVEIVGELTKAGLARSERLLKDVLSRLPLSS